MPNKQNPNDDEFTARLRRNHDDDPQTASLGRMSTGTTDDAAKQTEGDPYSLDGERVKTRRRRP